jgi:hypothetical protein
MSTKPVLFAVASAFSSIVLGAPGAAACQLGKVTEVPLFALGKHYATWVVLNDATRPMIVDTGAEVTTLTARSADEFKLPPDQATEAKPVLGVGQTQAVVHQNVIASSFGVGDLIYRNRSTVVGDMDFGKAPESEAIGLLGDDILSKFDVEFNFLSGRLSFYHTFRCYDSFLPWTGQYAMVPFDHHGAKIVVDVLLDRERTRAIVDTGNNASFISRDSPALWYVDESALVATRAVSTTPLNGGASAPVKSYTFETVELGGKIFHQVKMNVVDVDFPLGSANLGLDYWRTRKVWISYSRNWMFIADYASPLAYPVLNEHPTAEVAKAPPKVEEGKAPPATEEATTPPRAEETKAPPKAPAVRGHAPRMSDPLALP